MDSRTPIEVINGRLYFSILRTPPPSNPLYHYFSTDQLFVYWNFYLDFGPLNLSHVVRFCRMLTEKMSMTLSRKKTIYFYSGAHPHRVCNAIFLLGAFSIICLNKTPDEAFVPFVQLARTLPAYHDASPGICTYRLTVQDCLNGLYRAMKERFFDYHSFDVQSYEYYEKVENGDLNWIVDGKFLAFAGPHNTKSEGPGGYPTNTPEVYVNYFKKHNVNLVVRLNKKMYDETRFTRQGINHHEIYYLDGSNPSMPVLQRFLSICEQEPGAIAVHCKAGLGRTGTCIGAYLMKHYHFSAAEVIGWIRICRPGSIIGPQQQFLEEIQEIMWREGDRSHLHSRAHSHSASPRVDMAVSHSPLPSLSQPRPELYPAETSSPSSPSPIDAASSEEKVSQGDYLRLRHTPMNVKSSSRRFK